MINRPGDVTVIAPISVPGDANAAVRAASVLGGYVAVADTTERDAIPATSRKQGMMARTNDGAVYVLGAGLTNTDWALVNLVTGYAVGTVGQALISNGTTYLPGTNFSAQNLVTTGALSLGTNPSTTGTLRLANASTINFRNADNSADFIAMQVSGTSLVLQAESANGGGIQLLGGSTPLWSVGQSPTQSVMTLEAPVGAVAIMQFQNVGGNTSNCALQVRTTTANVGRHLVVSAQNADLTGGNLYLGSGNGPGVVQGRVSLNVGGFVNGVGSGAGIQLTELANLGTTAVPASVVSFCYGTAITTTEVPTGDGLIYLRQASTAPSSNPVGGVEIYSDSGGRLLTRSTTGTLAIGSGALPLAIVGTQSTDFISLGATPSSSGHVRLGNAANISFRNSTNTGDFAALSNNAVALVINSEALNPGIQFQVGGAVVAQFVSTGPSGIHGLRIYEPATNTLGTVSFDASPNLLAAEFAIHSTSNTNGVTLFLASQNASLNGGNLVIASGGGDGAGLHGRIRFQLGGVINAQLSGLTTVFSEFANLGSVTTPKNVISFCYDGSISTTQVPTGNKVIFIGEAGTAPGIPVGGTILYQDPADHFLKIREFDGVITTLRSVGSPYTVGTTGQALISNGTTYLPGTNFGAQNLVTTGSLSLGTTPSTTGTLRLAHGATVLGRTVANSADVALLDWGSTATNTFTIGGNSTAMNYRSGSGGHAFYSNTVLVLGVDQTDLAIGVQVVSFQSSVVSPTIRQLNVGSPSNMVVRAAGATSGNLSGGRLLLQGGVKNGTGLRRGPVLQLNVDDVDMFNMLEASEVVAGSRVLTLVKPGYLTTTEMPSGTGDLVVYVAEAATAPTANPANGFILFQDPADHRVKIREQSGLVTTLSISTTTTVTNTSSVIGTTATDALNTLKAHSMTGDINIPLSPMYNSFVASGAIALHTTGGGVVGTVADYWMVGNFTTSGNAGALFTVPLGGLPDGATLTEVRARIYPFPAGGSNFPSTMPRIDVYTTDSSGNGVLIGTVADSSPNKAAYETDHELVLTGLSFPVGVRSIFATISTGQGTLISGTKILGLVAKIGEA